MRGDRHRRLRVLLARIGSGLALLLGCLLLVFMLLADANFQARAALGPLLVASVLPAAWAFLFVVFKRAHWEPTAAAAIQIAVGVFTALGPEPTGMALLLVGLGAFSLRLPRGGWLLRDAAALVLFGVVFASMGSTTDGPVFAPGGMFSAIAFAAGALGRWRRASWVVGALCWRIALRWSAADLWRPASLALAVAPSLLLVAVAFLEPRQPDRGRIESVFE